MPRFSKNSWNSSDASFLQKFGDEHCCDVIEFLQCFYEGIFFFMGDHFLQDFLVVHCCNAVALIYCMLIQKTLFIQNNYYHNLSNTTHNSGFFWNWRCQSFPLWTLLLWFWAIMKHSVLIQIYHIAKFSLSLRLKLCV